MTVVRVAQHARLSVGMWALSGRGPTHPLRTLV
jgi:hypothetical protein